MTAMLLRSPSSLAKIFTILLICVSIFMYLSFFLFQRSSMKQIYYQSDNHDHDETLKSHNFVPGMQSFHQSSLVLIYNRVPKTGSTSFVSIAHQLCKAKGYHVIYLTVSHNKHYLNLKNQLKFVQNATEWNEVKPVIYHGHFHYIDFDKFGSPIRPLYINVIRNPLDRLVSYYYFLRFGDDYRPHVKRSRMKNQRLQMQTFDECVEVGGKDCRPEKLWMQIPFFCGHDYFCRKVGDKNALLQAKHNVLHRYFLVGVTDQMNDFVTMVEHLLPQYFQGANEVYLSNKRKLQLRKTQHKKPLKNSTLEYFKNNEIWRMEQDFYEFVKQVFKLQVKNMISVDENGDKIWSLQKFDYLRIRPTLKDLDSESDDTNKKH